MTTVAKHRIRGLFLWTATTRTLCTATATEGGKPTRLYRRLAELGCYPKERSVEETMEAWQREGSPVDRFTLMPIIKELRRYKCYATALQVADWMEKKEVKLNSSFHAVRLDLTFKVKGIETAEKYFFSIEEPAKETYGALLSNYCQANMVDKAVALLKKLKALNWASNPLVYNNIMSLHMRLGKHEKVLSYFQEMEAANIFLDRTTFNILMNSYASLGDINSVEKVYEQMRKSARYELDWSTYCNLAAIYNSSGLFEKSQYVLKEAEKLMNHRDQACFHFLISLYAGTGSLAEVKRMWNLLKSSFKRTTNRSYFTILNALKKLGDTDGLKECFQEWESCHELYDVRLANMGIDVYLKAGMRNEAESLLKKALEQGVRSAFKPVEIFANYCMERRETDPAIKCLELMTRAQRPSVWKPNKETIYSFLEYLEGAKDVDGAERVCRTLKKLDCLDSKDFELLLRTYLAAGRKDAFLSQRTVEDEIEVSPEIAQLLERVC